MAAAPKLTEDVRERLLGAISAGAGLDLAAHVAGVSRNAIYKLMARDKSFREDVEAARALAGDRVEQSVFKTAVKGNVGAQRLYLYAKRPQWNPNSEAKAVVSWVDLVKEATERAHKQRPARPEREQQADFDPAAHLNDEAESD